MEFLSAPFIENFHFLRPLWLLALLPAVLLFSLLTYLHGQRSAWNRAIEPDLLPFLLDRRGGPRQNRPLYGLLAAWVLASVALAGPVWQQIPTPVQEREDALVVVLDLSLSMYADDLSPDRITRARRKLVDLLDTRREEGLTALVVYAGDAHAVTPLTDDVETIGNLVPALDPNIMPVLGSNPDTGVQLALDLLGNAGIERAQLLLLTDGIKPADVGTIDDMLAGSGHALLVLGIGTEEGAPIPTREGGFLRDNNDAIVIPRLESARLRELAAATGGRYADAELTNADIDYLLDASIFEQNQNLVASEREFDSWQEAGPWLLLLVLPLGALAFRQGWLFCFCVAALLSMLPQKQAMAFEWRDLWTTRDQQGSEVFERDDYEAAARLFNDRRWEAAAHYRNENYQQTVEDLALLDDAESHYNRGNALARMQRFQQAIEAYDAALAQAPDHADALHNKEIVEALLEQQQQEEQQQQQQQQNSGENQDQQQQSSGDQQDQPSQSQQDQQQQQQQQQDGQQQEDQQNQQAQQSQGEQQESEQESQEQNEQEQQREQQASTARQDAADAEEEQSMQQWLRRIPDDPGELLRNKFNYQTQQKLLQQLRNPNLADQAPEEQIW